MPAKAEGVFLVYTSNSTIFLSLLLCCDKINSIFILTILVINKTDINIRKNVGRNEEIFEPFFFLLYGYLHVIYSAPINNSITRRRDGPYSRIYNKRWKKRRKEYFMKRRVRDVYYNYDGDTKRWMW